MQKKPNLSTTNQNKKIIVDNKQKSNLQNIGNKKIDNLAQPNNAVSRPNFTVKTVPVTENKLPEVVNNNVIPIANPTKGGYFFRFDVAYILPYTLQLNFNYDDKGSLKDQSQYFKPLLYTNLLASLSFGQYFSWFEWEVGGGYYPQFALWQANAQSTTTDANKGLLFIHNIPVFARLTFLVPFGGSGLSLGLGSSFGGNMYLGKGASDVAVTSCSPFTDTATNITTQQCSNQSTAYKYTMAGANFFMAPRLSLNYRGDRFGIQLYGDWLYSFKPIAFSATSSGTGDSNNANGTVQVIGLGGGVIVVGLSLGGYF